MYILTHVMANRFISGRVREIVYSPTFKIDLNQRRPRVLPISEKTGKIKLQLEEGVHDFGRGDKLQSRSRQQFQQTPNRNNKNRNNKFRPNNNNNRNNPNRNKK